MSPPLEQTNAPREKTETGSESIGSGSPVRSLTGRSGTSGLSQSELSRVLDERGFSEVPSCSCGKKADAIAARVRAGLSRDAATADVEARITTSGITSVEVQAPVIPDTRVRQKKEADKKADASISEQEREKKHGHDHSGEKTSTHDNEPNSGFVDTLTSWTANINVTSVVQGILGGASELASKVTQVVSDIKDSFTKLASLSSELDKQFERLSAGHGDAQKFDKTLSKLQSQIDITNQQLDEAHRSITESDKLTEAQKKRAFEALDERREMLESRFKESFEEHSKLMEERNTTFVRDTDAIIECCDVHNVCGEHRCEVEKEIARVRHDMDEDDREVEEQRSEIQKAIDEGKFDLAEKLLAAFKEADKDRRTNSLDVSTTLRSRILADAQEKGEAADYIREVGELGTRLIDNQRRIWDNIVAVSAEISEIGKAYIQSLSSLRDMGFDNLGGTVVGMERTDAALRSKWTPGTLYSGAYAMSDLYFYEEVEKLEAGIPFPMEASEGTLSGSFSKDQEDGIDSLDAFNQKVSAEKESFVRVIEGVFEQSEGLGGQGSFLDSDSGVVDNSGSIIPASVSADLERHLGGAMDSFLADAEALSVTDDSLTDEQD